jgi:hypothetical protein
MRSILLTILVSLFASVAISQDSGSLQCSTDRFLSSIENENFDDVFFLDENIILVSLYGELRTYNISDPTNIVEIASLTIDPDFQTAELYQGYVFLIDKSPGKLTIVDVQNPNAMNIVAELSIPTLNSYDYTITIANDIAYLDSPTGELLLFNISDPTSPTLISTTTPDHVIIDMQAVGSMLFVRSNDLYIYDYTDPLNPIERGQYTPTQWISSIHIDDTTAFLVDGFDELLAIDVSDIDNPTLIGHLSISSVVTRIFTIGNKLYLAGSSSGIFTVDISDLSDMSMIGHTLKPGFLHGLAANDANLISTNYRGLSIIDAPLTVAPPPKQAFSATVDSAKGIDIQGDYAYIADDHGGVTIFNITIPFSPLNVSSVATSDRALNLKVDQDLLYVAALTGVDIFDVSDPYTPTLVGYIPITKAVGLDVQDNLLAIYSTEPGFVALYDIVDPTDPVHLSTHQGPEYPEEIIIRDDKVYVAGGYSTLVIMDISDPNNITTAGIYDAPGIVEFSYSIALVEDIAYVSTDFGLLYAINISNPFNPALIGTTPINNEPTEIDAINNRLVVSSFGPDIHVYDITNVNDIKWIVGTLGIANDLQIVDQKMFAASGLNGMWVLDIGECNQCSADFNDDHELNFFDISAFLSAFTNNDPAADFNADSDFNFFDISAYLDAFSSGCP